MSSSEKIKQLRKEKGFTQRQLADLTGIAEITIRQYEAGKYEPKLDKLRKLAAALGVYIYELEPDWSKIPFEDVNEDLKNGLPLDELEILQNYHVLNATGKDEAKKRVQELTEIPRYRKDTTPNHPKDA